MSTLFAFVGLLAVLIAFHEMGHLLAARWCGVKVLRFSLGFGKVLFCRSAGVDRTEWVISAIPLGGYVKMLDEREGEVAPAEVHRAFNRQSVGKRSLIVAAGPLANFALAVLLYWVVFVGGSDEMRPLLGTPPENTPAAVLGIKNGDDVRRVDGIEVATWQELRWQLLQRAAEQGSVELEIINPRHEIAVLRLPLSEISAAGWEGDGLARLGIVFYRPEVPPVIGRVMVGGPAEQAGLLADDRVLAVRQGGDWKDVRYWHELVAVIRTGAGQALSLEIARGDQVFTVDVTPEAVFEHGATMGKIGVAVADFSAQWPELHTFVRYPPAVALAKALEETWDKSVFSLVMLGKMLTGEVSWKNISGPVTIADYAGRSAHLGWDYYLKFMAMVSISLGVLNLLPIPVLDGGHLMYHALEVVRRRPLSEKTMALTQQVGMSLLLVLMAFAFFNDLNRLFFG